jgi:hypothetical protein
MGRDDRARENRRTRRMPGPPCARDRLVNDHFRTGKCVSRRQTCSVGVRPTGARARRPVAWMAGRRETDALKPIDDAIGKDGREWPGRNVSERKGSPESAKPRRPSVCFSREGRRDRRRLADAAAPLRRGVSDGTVTRTRPAPGEALLVPPGNRRSWVGRITGAPGKAADDERVADGPVRARRRGNARGAKGPCCSATPPATRKAGAS